MQLSDKLIPHKNKLVRGKIYHFQKRENRQVAKNGVLELIKKSCVVLRVPSLRNREVFNVVRLMAFAWFYITALCD